MKEMKRILALVLCFVMLVGLVPATAFEAKAAEETIYILAGGDFQEAGDHANSAANVTNILAQISQKYTTMNGFLFIGDYDCETHDSATETANGITALMGAVQGSYSNLNDANSVLVQGNHDYMDSRIDATGGHEFEGYSVYVLNEDDYPNGGGSQSGIQTLANNLKTWLNNKIGEGYEAPIFITSHLPLAFTPRTQSQGDAKYAKYIFDVLNDAADNGLNIIFLHGHDHAYGYDNYLGGEAIYLKKGDSILIAEAGSQTAYTTETLNFTYMNAGYTGYYSDGYVTTDGTDKLTMTVFAITGTEVTVERYSASGLYNLKSEGRTDGSHNMTVPAVNGTTYASPQTITLAEVADFGDIGSWVGVTPTGTDDVTTSNKGWVELIAPVPGTEATPGSTTYKYVLDTDGVNTNTKYLIVNTSSNGDAYVLTNNNGNVNRTPVTISNGEIIVENETNINWIFSGSTSGNVNNNGTHLRPGNGSLFGNSTNLSINNQGNGAYRISRSSSGTTYYVKYTNNNWTGASGTTNRNVYLFAYDSTITTPGTEATPGSNGTYGKIVGNLSYEATVGMTADEAMALVQGGIDGYYYDAMSTPGSDVTGTIVDDSVLTWEWVDTFDGNTAGDYEVAIKYGDFLLGTAEVVVPAATTYYVAEGNGLYLVDMNTTETNAMAAVKDGITVYSAADANGTGKTAISDDDVTWKWVDKYSGVNAGPYTVAILKDGTSLGTVEVKVDVHYDTGIAEGWVNAGTSSTTYRYVLDTDGYETGTNNRYLFVASNAAYAMDEDGSGVVSVTFNGDETEAIVDSRDYEWYIMTRRSGNTTYYTVTKNGSTWIYHENYGMSVGTNDNGYWTINENDQDEGLYRFSNTDGSPWYLYYDSADRRMEVSTSNSNRVRLYKYDGEIPGSAQYVKIEGNTVYTVSQSTSVSSAMAKVKAGITGYVSNNADGSDATELDDSKLTWTWKNSYNGKVTGSYWVEISYNGVVLGTVEVRVEPGVINNYPEYPNEGAVKVSKTATGIAFQSSGVAQVEVSASGVPAKKGVDVIVMLDTSSSMRYCLDCAAGTAHDSYVCDQGGQTRAQALEETLADLIAQFKTPGADGEILDIDVAIADFNGFYGDDVDNENNNYQTGTPYDRDDGDTMSDGVDYNAVSAAQVYTNDTGALDATAFVAAEDLSATYDLSYASGTNYDYAFDAIYQMATAKKIANGSEERDLYVIFMSDGAAMQWNYYHSQGASNLWENWITGAWDADELSLSCNTHAYYYDEVDHDGDGNINEHRMANAVKGDPTKTYEVIRKTDDLGTPTDEDNMYMVPGLGATLFSIAFDPRTDDQVEAEHMVSSIATLASDQTGTTRYFYDVDSADALASAFNAIGTEIAYAASNARFVDQMGDDFNLQMTPIVDFNGDPIEGANLPSIEIITYDIYTRQDWLDEKCEESQIGDRKGTYTILETVTFNTDGTEAYSTMNSTGPNGTITAGSNILIDGVIYASTFWYNTLPTPVEITGVDIPDGTKADGTTTGSSNVLPSETFYWKLGTVQTSELAMRYYVYLEGSMDGTREAGSYPTNEYAILYYDNYLGNPCHKDTNSPVVAWKEANVSYAFYLVNENGEIIVNQTTGLTGSFANKIAVTNPVLYKTINLNNSTDVTLSVLAEADDVLPDYYTLYDPGAVYTVRVNSNSTGSWSILTANTDTDQTNNKENLVNSTYVTQFDPEDASHYSNALTNSDPNDYTHTIVWFAVVWSVQAHPDAVVIDYGLPVDIDVLNNDMFGTHGKLAGVGAYTDGIENTTAGANQQTGFANRYTGTYGTADITTTPGKVRYTLNTSNGMQMQTYEKFAYAVSYKNTNENADTTKDGYYYDTVTIIPATSIYYEDSFLEFETLTWQQKEGGQVWEGEWAVVQNPDKPTWTQVGTVINGATQDEDRPGQYSLTDANNIYGYDSVNLNMATYSLGSAMKATVDYDNAAQASFEFYGTGFDVISMTDSTTGTIYVDVYKVNDDGTRGERIKSNAVDTYYGYTQAECHVIYTWKDTNLGVDTDGDGNKTNDHAWVKSDVLHVKTECTDACNEEIVDERPEDAAVGLEVHMIDNAWIESPTSERSIWQVPVMQVEELTYGRYEAVIQAVYEPAFDHNTSTPTTYDFYLDAIRIYDPANDGAADGTDDTTIEDAYVLDGEGWPSYFELRNNLIAANTLGNTDTSTVITGEVFIDGDATVGDGQLSDYTNFGPNNEVYLAPGQSIAFILGNVTDNVANIHIGIKSADGSTATYTITNIARFSNADTGVEAGTFYGAKTATVNTSTDMYYDLTGWKNDIIVITNTGDLYNTDGILSLTNIKTTYKTNPNGAAVVDEGDEDDEESGITVASAGDLDSGISVASVTKQNSDVSVLSTAAETEETVETVSNEVYAYMTPAAAALTVRALNAPTEDEIPDETESTEPEVTEPETTVPEETEPETTVPEETEPETTVPEETEPETTVPEETEPSVEEVVETIVKEIIKAIGGWLRKWF